MTELPFAHGGPPLRGKLRVAPEDFFVDEQLGFAPDGAGEHVFVHVEKRGANTEWVARELAKFARVNPVAVSYSGIKDRHAVTRQTFSLHLPGKADPDWSQLRSDEFRVLSAARHGRKLKRGAHASNAFRIVLRDVEGDRAAADEAMRRIAQHGVPNYFGEQRFGRDAANVERALAMFGGRRVQRHERSLLLSAARSELFNRVLASRVDAGNWNTPLDGDVWMLRGSHSIFGPEPISDALVARCTHGDIAPTGPLWGDGALRTTGPAAQLEQHIADAHATLAAGLAAAGLRQERRALVLAPDNVAAEWSDAASLTLAFVLPAGAYATVVVRELCATDRIA